MTSDRVRIDPAFGDGGNDRPFSMTYERSLKENGVEILFYEQDCRAAPPGLHEALSSGYWVEPDI